MKVLKISNKLRIFLILHFEQRLLNLKLTVWKTHTHSHLFCRMISSTMHLASSGYNGASWGPSPTMFSTLALFSSLWLSVNLIRPCWFKDSWSLCVYVCVEWGLQSHIFSNIFPWLHHVYLSYLLEQPPTHSNSHKATNIDYIIMSVWWALQQFKLYNKAGLCNM